MKFPSRSEHTVEETAGRSADEDEPTARTKSRLITFLQGATVFVVMFVTLWWLLSRGERDAE